MVAVTVRGDHDIHRLSMEACGRNIRQPPSQTLGETSPGFRLLPVNHEQRKVSGPLVCNIVVVQRAQFEGSTDCHS